MLPSVARLLLLRAEHRADQSRDGDEWSEGRRHLDAGHYSPEHSARHKPNDITGDLSTSQECHSERDRIGNEMAKAYPGDHDFEIACQFSPWQQS
jgi:hypothetical protein